MEALRCFKTLGNASAGFLAARPPFSLKLPGTWLQDCWLYSWNLASSFWLRCWNGRFFEERLVLRSGSGIAAHSFSLRKRDSTVDTHPISP